MTVASRRPPGLAPRLARIEAELTEARRRAHALAEPLDEAGWATRPGRDEWSVAECLMHLNLTSRAFLPLIAAALARGREQKLLSHGPYRRDFVGWLLGHVIEPPVPIRTKTTAPFVPRSYSCLRIIPAHQRLHLAHAEQVIRRSGLHR